MSNDTAPNYRHFALTEGLYEIHAESDMRSMLNPRPTKAVSSSSPSSTQGLAREWREAAGTRPRQSRQRPGPGAACMLDDDRRPEGVARVSRDASASRSPLIFSLCCMRWSDTTGPDPSLMC